MMASYWLITSRVLAPPLLFLQDVCAPELPAKCLESTGLPAQIPWFEEGNDSKFLTPP